MQYAVIIGVYALLFGFWHLQPEPVPLQVHLAGVLLAAICMFPMARWYARGAQGIPMFEIICLAYGVQYALPLYLQPNQAALYTGAATLDWSTTFQALLLTALGMGSMIIAYYWGRKSRWASRVPRMNLQIEDAKLTRYILFAFVFGLGTTVLSDLHMAPNNSGPVGGLVRLVSFQSVVALALLAIRVFSAEQRSRGWSYVLYIWLATSVLLGFTTGMLENAFAPALMVVLVYWQTSRKIPWKPLLVGTFVFLVLQPIKQEYRAQTWGAQHVPITQRVTLWFQDSLNLIQQVSSGDVGQNAQTVSSNSTGRIDYLHEFSLVVALSPNTVPYAGGNSYAYLAYSWIPRFVWPSKPVTSDATNYLALRYGLLNPIELGTVSIGLGQAAEAYGNFGLPGVIIVMGLQGLFFAFLDLMLNGEESRGGRGIYLAQMIWFLNGIGAATAIILGGFIQQLLPTIMIMKIFARKPSRRTSDTRRVLRRVEPVTAQSPRHARRTVRRQGERAAPRQPRVTRIHGRAPELSPAGLVGQVAE